MGFHPAKPQPLRAIGYVRVSTDKQDISPDVQAAKVFALAQLHDLHLLRIESDTASAAHLERPGWQAVRRAVEAGEVHAVLVAKLDRLTRSTRDLDDLLRLFKAHRVALLSAGESLDTSSASGKFFVKMLGLMSEWERETISERTIAALAERKRKGQRTGEPPFGMKALPDKRLVPEPAELRVLADAHELRTRGLSYVKTADALTARGYRTRGGGPWTGDLVFRMLKAAARRAAEQSAA